MKTGLENVELIYPDDKWFNQKIERMLRKIPAKGIRRLAHASRSEFHGIGSAAQTRNRDLFRTGKTRRTPSPKQHRQENA
jgi:hypothetical protein